MYSDNIYYRPIYEGLEKILVAVFSLCALECACVMGGSVFPGCAPPPPPPPPDWETTNGIVQVGE